MILIVNLCKEKMHEQEFVRPVCRILDYLGEEYRVKEYFRLRGSDLEAEKVILCGTSLRDFAYLQHIKAFDWLKEFKGDILGICGGCQILTHLFGGEILRSREIGKTLVRLKRPLFSLPEEFFVYSLHNLGIVPPLGFEIVAESEGGVQMIKKEEPLAYGGRQILGVLFHPEVLNKEIIERFVGK